MVLRHGQLCVCERLPSQGGVKALVGTGRHVNVGVGAATGPLRDGQAGKEEAARATPVAEQDLEMS